MSSSIKPIVVHGKIGPNPPKVHMLLNELGLPHTTTPHDFTSIKQEPYLTKVNPNGRMPAIEDPNTDLTLWESGAILQYLVETYDKEHKVSFPAGSNESHLAKQWLFFQTTGQGPYYGQFVWFTKYHEPKVPSAVERYAKEINRVTAVLETHLSKQADDADGNRWLVGGRFSYADLAFVPWQYYAGMLAKDYYKSDDYPHVKKWLDALVARPAIKKVVEEDMAR
ncbi:hypothetical protein MCOR27_010833 [Pyricularia oryzae]|uniref:Glutathione S-transferase n=2 Tax=Pyricularia TaxID=48558 RepID=A0ABQ8N3H4_PYRGI|nr:hypothetical protein MCOR01_010141 [Pyricularia oryzae]KAI6290673.1 hypothetical protein MCOR33_011144 [Pyricularia grisea]KAH9436521.1 hypothetical protein MCOR02_000195 [Pyricularia oryzae]KAI6253884.1 hypothetical protein MCOR19_009582 [Pyricularia oryzae]KAI6266888.1 hypothetical protein MCOR27_010833 [Pyricularia oryzae]